MTTLYREIDALGGAVEDAWGEGYSEALADVLAILLARGHSEHCDPALDALVKIEADPANVALYLDCGGRYAIAKARGEVQP